MKIKDRAAQALDKSLPAATQKIGLYTDSARNTLAAWLDGDFKLPARTVKKYCEYLEMVSK